jgi:hypothetical protein
LRLMVNVTPIKLMMTANISRLDMVQLVFKEVLLL